MTRYLLGLSLFALGCGPTEPVNRETHQVSAAGLIAYYRDYARGDAYTNQRIQVRLEPRTYSIDGGDVAVSTGLPHTPPVIVFHAVERIEADPRKHWLVLTGICRGAIRDGVRKADRINFVIVVDECRVTRVETQ